MTQAGVFTDAYAPIMPLDTTVSSSGFPIIYPVPECDLEALTIEDALNSSPNPRPMKLLPTFL